ncbi:TetR/AcrR family transcriptional regulator [Streptomyces chartreusis]|uniref:TetR/AcrR family transcriptional regulator n=1 Tax=Streptomyces chartreusis TaxID=1969 RepID=UPI003636D600
MTESTPVRQRRGRGARERILKAATELFRAQGINATGMDQLASVATVSKRSLYVHFASKDKLVQAYLQGLDEDLLPAPVSPDAEVPDPREELLAVFDSEARHTVSPLRGCPFLNVSVEVPDPRHPAHQLAAAHKTEFARRLADVARRSGLSSPEVLGEQLAVLFDGAVARSVVLNSAETFDCARSIAETLIDAALVDARPSLG